ncbi:MAG TPA: hypothetical protein VG318_15495 [Actinomycetota bacterium]|nr:hypothetical protein [Actinomycetota bacterium]
MERERDWCDERGVVVTWLLRVLVVIAIIGAVLFDVGAIGVNFFTLDGTADEVAVEVSTLVSTGTAPVPNLQCLKRSNVPACAAVYNVAREHGVKVVTATFDQEGVFHIELRRTANTLIVSRIGPIEDWATATASASAGTTN